MFQSAQLHHGSHETGILALDPDFFPDAHLLALVAKHLVCLVVGGWTLAAQGDCQAVSDAEARVGLRCGVWGRMAGIRAWGYIVEGADVEDEG